MRALWGLSDEDLWAVGTGGTLPHYDGTRWSRVGEPASYSLNGIWGSSATDVWAVGTGSTELHYDGNAWSALRSGTEHTLNAVRGGGVRLWIVGERDTVLTREL